MRKIFGTRTLALSAIGLVGLALQGAAAPAKAYDINVILALTGGGAFLGKEQQTALQVAETVINKAGGVHGQNVHFVFHDDQTNPQTAVQLTNQVIASKPTVLLGSTLVASCNAMAALMQNGPVMYCFSPVIRPAKGSYVFTADVSTVDLVGSLIRYFRLMGWTRIAIMISNDAQGQNAEPVFEEVFARPENKEVTVVERAHFNVTDVSVAAQIEHIREAKPQALIAWSSGSPIATVFKGIVQAGLDIPVGSPNSNMTYAQMKAYAAFLPKQLYIPSTEWVPRQGVVKLDPAVEKAQKQFFDAFEAVKIKPDHGANSRLGSGHDPGRCAAPSGLQPQRCAGARLYRSAEGLRRLQWPL